LDDACSRLIKKIPDFKGVEFNVQYSKKHPTTFLVTAKLPDADDIPVVGTYFVKKEFMEGVK
jgi:hypothetical protein